MAEVGALIDAAMPLVVDDRTAEGECPSNENGTPLLSEGSFADVLGNKLKSISGHCDPTVKLHDWHICGRGAIVEAIWPLICRGALF